MHVLFVCTGNICRSPTAERLLAAQAAAHGWDVSASSAGTRAVVDHAMEPSAAAVLAELGGDADGFRGRQLTAAMIDGADLVLAMTAAHRGKVLDLRPAALRRTFTLREAAQLVPDAVSDEPAPVQLARHRRGFPARELDVPDPIGLPRAEFERAGAMVADALTRLAPLWSHAR
ncbi:hypothetical protein GCM10027047_34220 [Rhodococcus aerolatus]